MAETKQRKAQFRLCHLLLLKDLPLFTHIPSERQANPKSRQKNTRTFVPPPVSFS